MNVWASRKTYIPARSASKAERFAKCVQAYSVVCCSGNQGLGYIILNVVRSRGALCVCDSDEAHIGYGIFRTTPCCSGRGVCSTDVHDVGQMGGAARRDIDQRIALSRLVCPDLHAFCEVFDVSVFDRRIRSIEIYRRVATPSTRDSMQTKRCRLIDLDAGCSSVLRCEEN